MARRPGEEGRFNLSPRSRLVAGWIAAIGVIVVIALVVGILGGNGDGSPVAPNVSPTPSAAASATAITFGTALDPETAQVPADAQTDRFSPADTFGYSVPAGATAPSPPATVYVEVERTGGGEVGIVQNRAPPDGDQTVPAGRPAVAFTVPAARLFDAFGAGEYVMRIYVDPTGEPIAEGRFTLVAEAASAPAAPSAQP